MTVSQNGNVASAFRIHNLVELFEANRKPMLTRKRREIIHHQVASPPFVSGVKFLGLQMRRVHNPNTNRTSATVRRPHASRSGFFDDVESRSKKGAKESREHLCIIRMWQKPLWGEIDVLLDQLSRRFGRTSMTLQRWKHRAMSDRIAQPIE